MKQKHTIDTSNDEFIKAVEHVMRNAVPPKVVRHVGQLNEVEVDGRKIKRQEKIYIGDGRNPQDDIGWTLCAPTDNHFVYRYTGRAGWTLFCTCGSPAVVVGHDAYKEMGSNQGQMLVCMSMLYNKRHQDGSM